MSQLVTESIWHFIGYLHLEELLNKTPILYSGAGTYAQQTLDFPMAAPGSLEAEVLFSTGRDTPSVKLGLPAEPQVIFHMRPEPIVPLDFKVAVALPAVNPPLDLSTVLPGLSGADISIDSAHGGSRTASAKTVIVHQQDLSVSATYTVGESQYSDIHIVQANALFDVDVMRGAPGAIAQAGLEHARMQALGEGAEELAELIEEAMEALPSSVIPASPADGIHRVSASNDGELQLQIPLESDVVAETVEAGRYVNGERVGDAGAARDVIKAQVEKIDAALEAAKPEEHGGPEPVTTPDGGAAHVTTGAGPTGGVAQEVIAGGNDLVNAAVLYDLADAAGSMIVRGDVHVTDAIVQVNVLQDNDQANASGDHASGFSGAGFLAAAVAANEAGSEVADNAVTNEAVFAQETGPVYGNVMLGGWPGSLIWQVDYVQGNLYDLTTIEQTNLIVDGDIAEQTTTGTHFVATLGEDGAINLVQLSELGASYDLIIVGGHLYEFNGIVQVNVLLDDDIVDQVAEDDGGTQAINTDGNVLANDAAIVRIGGDSYKPLEGDPEALADAIGSMQTEFDPSLTTGLPGNGTDTLKVLYVTGDYYNYNVLVQMNMLHDADQVQQVAPPAGEAGQTSGTAQIADTGSNTLQNVALLVNVGSTSDYQFIGGEVYEDTLLVQANIVVDEDEGNAADLHPDVVATLAALSGGGADATPGSDSPVDHPDTSASVDVIGGLLT